MTRQKKYSMLVAFIYVLNNNISGGLLALPFVFYHGGLLVSLLLLLLVTVVTIPPLLWTLETMARAQALEDSALEEASDGQWSRESTEREQFYRCLKPVYRIDCDRKFELDELCQIFIAPFVGHLFGWFVVIWCELSMWYFVTLAASAWAAHIPFNIDGFQQCSDEDFRMVVHPSGPCWNTYTLCVVMFGVIVVPISLMDLTEQRFVQVSLGVVRGLGIVIMVGYCLVGLLSDNVVPGKSEESDREQVWLKLDVIGGMAVIPVVFHALACLLMIPSFVQPVEDKRKLHVMLAVATLCCAFVYIVVGVTVSLHFQSQLVETSTLNWVPFTEPGNALSIRILSSFIVLHISLVMVSAMPMSAVASANYIMSLCKGNVGSQPSNFTKIVIRFCTVMFPLIGAILVTNLVDVLEYGGLAGYFCTFIIPALLVVKSKRRCQKVFAPKNRHNLAGSYFLSGVTGDKGGPVSLVSWDDKESRLPHFDLSATPYTGIWSTSVVVWLVIAFSCIATMATVVSMVVPSS